MYKTGEKPGVGDYKCTHCNQEITLDNASDKLPPCPKCSKTNWIKVG